VYAARVETSSAPATAYAAAVSIGPKPTFAGRRTVIESHLLDFDRDLYGQSLTIHFVRWIRDQYAFPHRDALVAQLRRDLATTRRLLPLPAAA
jgi:riboflavin kinase/FMN adenylyltransferase